MVGKTWWPAEKPWWEQEAPLVTVYTHAGSRKTGVLALRILPFIVGRFGPQFT